MLLENMVLPEAERVGKLSVGPFTECVEICYLDHKCQTYFHDDANRESTGDAALQAYRSKTCASPCQMVRACAKHEDTDCRVCGAATWTWVMRHDERTINRYFLSTKESGYCPRMCDTYPYAQSKFSKPLLPLKRAIPKR